ncbi:MAG: hypothetical protein JO352_33805 [Chloroflexi bacterium]|nr:hypothetical protein [Chloroflexota bacterium]
MLCVNWAQAGHVLTAGAASTGVHQLLSALVLELARRQPPTERQIAVLGRADRLPGVLQDLPHGVGTWIDPADASAVTALFEALQSEVLRRLETSLLPSPELVLVVDEWTELPPLGPSLDVVAHHGPAVGVRLLAGCTQVDTPDLERSVGLFETRLVLRVPEAQSSVVLLGEPRAEDLDGVGEAWPLVSGRILPRVRGFRIPPEHATALIAEMHRRLASADAATPTESVPCPPPCAASGPQDVAAGNMAGHMGEPAATVLTEPQPEDTEDRQLPLIRAVPLSPRDVGPRLEVQVLGGHMTRLAGGEAIAEGTSLGWQLFELTASYPPGDATVALVGRLLWPELDLSDDQVARRIYNHVHDLQTVWSLHVGPARAREVLRARRRTLMLDQDLVMVDLHQFLAALETATRARAAHPTQATDEEMHALLRARALYTGPLLAGRETDYPWVPALQDVYRAKERAATERLANLLLDAGRPQEAADLYRDLLRDPGPAEAEYDEDNYHAYRERMARRLFECCRRLRDLGELVRTRDELLSILQRLDAEDMTEEATRLGTATTSLFGEIYRELAEDDSSAVAGDS